MFDGQLPARGPDGFLVGSAPDGGWIVVDAVGSDVLSTWDTLSEAEDEAIRLFKSRRAFLEIFE